jgi:hypothetical protein
MNYKKKYNDLLLKYNLLEIKNNRVTVPLPNFPTPEPTDECHPEPKHIYCTITDIAGEKTIIGIESDFDNVEDYLCYIHSNTPSFYFFDTYCKRVGDDILIHNGKIQILSTHIVKFNSL